MSLETQNQYDKLVLDFNSQHEDKKLVERLQEKYKEKPLHVRLKATSKAVSSYTYLANAVSFLTGFFLISYFLKGALIPFLGFFFATLIASIIGLLAMGLVELLKRGSNDAFYIGAFRFKSFKLLPFLGILATTGTSVALSYYGGKQIPKSTTAAPKELKPKLLNIDEIKEDYNKQIATLKAEQKAYFEANKKPKNKPLKGYRLSSKLMPTYNQFNDRISEAEKERKHELAYAKEQNGFLDKVTSVKNAERKAAHKEATTEQANILGALVLFFELGFLLGMWFLHWLDWGTFCLLLALHEAEKAPTNNNLPTPNNLVITEQIDPNDIPIQAPNTNDPYIRIERFTKDPIFNMQRIKNFIHSYTSKLAKDNTNESAKNGLERWKAHELELLNQINQTPKAL